MHGLTERQQEALRLIRASIDAHGYPPTLRELCTSMGIRSTNGVNDHLRALEKKGFIKREDLKSRSIRIRVPERTLSVTGAPVRLPIFHRLFSHGVPTEVLDEISIAHASANGATYGVIVPDDALIERGILPGDYLLLRPTQELIAGKIAAFYDGDEAIFRIFAPELLSAEKRISQAVAFKAAKAGMPPIVIDPFSPKLVVAMAVSLYRSVGR